MTERLTYSQIEQGVSNMEPKEIARFLASVTEGIFDGYEPTGFIERDCDMSEHVDHQMSQVDEDTARRLMVMAKALSTRMAIDA